MVRNSLIEPPAEAGQNGALLCIVGDAPSVSLQADSEIPVPSGCWIRFNLESGGCWYGHGFSHRQPYPLNAEPVVNAQFAVNNIQSPIWMCSAGFALLADTTQTLEVRSNEHGNGWLEVRCAGGPFVFRVFQGADLPQAHAKLMRHAGWPPPAPEKSLLGDSIFCTWTQYPRSITQKRIVGMAKAIRERKFPCSVITIDDRWESTYGELDFSRNFPDPKTMITELHAMGFRVVLWVTPFVNSDAATFSELAGKGLLALNKERSGPSLLKWWGGTAGIVDITNPEGREWYRAQLLRLKNDIGVDGFKIDGGDAKYQPNPATTSWHEEVGPSGYVDRLLALFEEIAPNMCESRTAWLSQRRKILWREGGKDSHWGVDNGMQAMVRLGLHLALLGYDLLIPDMVPGRMQTMVSTLPLPTDEFFIRWTEVSALMPIMQFSYLPWNYAEPTAAIVQGYAELHKSLEDYLHEHARDRIAPLMRPLWYDYPDREEFYSIADEFLLGPDILVAPVLEENTVARDVLLPPGEWRDAWTGKTWHQERILQHPTPCPGMPIFVRAERMELCNTLTRILKTIARGTVASGQTTTTYSCGIDRDLNVSG